MAGHRLPRLGEFGQKQTARIRALSKYQKILAVAILCYILILSTITGLKFYCFKTQTFDFGIFVQISWQTINGNFMFTQPRAGPLHPTSFLGVHVSPLLLLIIALYAVAATPYTLLVVQTTALGFAALFIFRIGHKVTGKERVALLFALAYLLYPGTLWPNWYDFHLEAFVPLFSGMIFYYYFSGKKLGVILSMLLLLTTFERSVFIVGLFIFYIAIRELHLRRRKENDAKFLSKWMIVGLVIVVVVAASYFLASENLMNSVWPERELRQPTKIFGQITYNMVLLKISYIVLLTAPLAFLSFDSPLELLPAVPYLFLAMTTDYEPYFTLTWQYPALVSVPFFVSAIFGWKHQERRGLWKKLAALMLICVVLFNPGSPFMSQFDLNWTIPVPSLEYQLRYKVLSSVEATATVLAQENIFPNIAERRVAYTLWPNNSSPPDYIIVDIFDTIFYREPAEESTKNALLRFTKQYSYGVFKEVNGFLILRKDYSGPKEVLMPLHISLEPSNLRKPFVAFEDLFMETHFFAPDWVELENDHLFITKNTSGNSWWGPWITVPPGKYKVEVQYSVNESVEGPFMGVVAYYWRPSPVNEIVYARRTILGNETIPGQKNVAVFEFELKDWVPSLYIVVTSYGKADINVYSVKLEETD